MTTLEDFNHNGRCYTITQNGRDYTLTVTIPATVTVDEETIVMYSGPSYREALKELNKAIASR